MSTSLLQQSRYLGIRQQPLHEVLIYAPTIIWVQQGHKQLWWRERRLSFDKGSWLWCLPVTDSPSSTSQSKANSAPMF